MTYLFFSFFLIIIYFLYIKFTKKFNISVFHISNLALVALIGFFVLLIIIFPRVSYTAASSGIKLWFNIVLPSLLPFFIGSELLIGLGFVNFLGTLLEPLMRKVFNVPGAGSFAVAMGFTSGYPTGAKITANLRQKELCSKVEGERLLTFTNNSGPLFILGAIAVGMFDNPQLGIVLALAHYLAAITVGFLFRFYKKGTKSIINEKSKNSMNIFRKAFREMFRSRKKDGRTIGMLLGDSVRNSMNLLLLIGGFIIFFSVVISILTQLGVFSALTTVLAIFLKPFGINEQLINAMLCGFFELTTGTKMAAFSSGIYINKVMTTAFILGWAGLSVHLQVISIISKTDLSAIPYLIAKFMQSVIAATYTYFLFKKMSFFESISVFNPLASKKSSWLQYFVGSSELLFAIIGMMFVVSLIGLLLKSIKKTKPRL